MNDEVQIIVYQLQSRGESIQHLTVNLFKGYEAAADKLFVSYIHLKKFEYNKGGSIDVDKLMSHAENQYTEIIRAKEWHQPPKENQEILVLTAEIKVLKKQYLNGERGNRPRNLDKNKNAWKKGVPKEGEVKLINGKTLNWCMHHKLWCIHKPSECCIGLPTENVASNNGNEGQAEIATTELAMALAALKMDESRLASGNEINFLPYSVLKCLHCPSFRLHKNSVEVMPVVFILQICSQNQSNSETNTLMCEAKEPISIRTQKKTENNVLDIPNET